MTSKGAIGRQAVLNDAGAHRAACERWMLCVPNAVVGPRSIGIDNGHSLHNRRHRMSSLGQAGCDAGIRPAHAIAARTAELGGLTVPGGNGAPTCERMLLQPDCRGGDRSTTRKGRAPSWTREVRQVRRISSTRPLAKLVRLPRP